MSDWFACGFSIRMPTPSSPVASIIVCTRNRADDLEKTCVELLAMIAQAPPCELLVVDNGSNDRTPVLLTELAAHNPDRLHWIREPRPGLSTARNTGIAQTHGEIVIFIDDDAIPDEGWLAALVTEFSDPGIWAAGGPVRPIISSAFPDWFSARFLPYLSAWDRGSEAEDLSYNEYPRGTNMAFRRRVFSDLGTFLPQLGRQGRSLRSCEETELCLRIERSGHRIRYLPAARVVHKVDVGRLTKAWMTDRFFAQGFSEALMEWRHAGFEGLRIGLRRSAFQVRQASGPSDPTSELFRTCQTGARRGYVAGSLYGALRIPRYTSSRTDQMLAPWLPPL